MQDIITIISISSTTLIAVLTGLFSYLNRVREHRFEIDKIVKTELYGLKMNALVEITQDIQHLMMLGIAETLDVNDIIETVNRIKANLFTYGTDDQMTLFDNLWYYLNEGAAQEKEKMATLAMLIRSLRKDMGHEDTGLTNQSLIEAFQFLLPPNK
jgi:hypothetical protein